MRSPAQVPGSATSYDLPFAPEEWVRDDGDVEGGPALHAFLLEVWQAAADRFFGEQGVGLSDPALSELATQIAEEHAEKLRPEQLAAMAVESPRLRSLARGYSPSLERGLRSVVSELGYFSLLDLFDYLA